MRRVTVDALRMTAMVRMYTSEAWRVGMEASSSCVRYFHWGHKKRKKKAQQRNSKENKKYMSNYVYVVYHGYKEI
jgi:hypothetical protein